MEISPLPGRTGNLADFLPEVYATYHPGWSAVRDAALEQSGALSGCCSRVEGGCTIFGVGRHLWAASCCVPCAAHGYALLSRGSWYEDGL